MVKIKICGITNLKDALAAAAFGADALGFIFAESPRRVTPEAARAIIAELPPFITKVGVFVNRPIDEIRRVMDISGVDLAQLHGGERPEDCAALFPKVIKAFTPNTIPPLEELRRYRVAAFLIDREKGPNKSSPEDIWPIAREVSAYGKVILAGGLAPENVSKAIEIAQPYAVDISSGIEESPGKKDHRKMREFIEAIRAKHSEHRNAPPL